MEPKIRYVQTTDGMDIAYFKMGTGVPYVRMPAVPMDHIQMHYSTHGRGYAAAIGARMMLV